MTTTATPTRYVAGPRGESRPVVDHTADPLVPAAPAPVESRPFPAARRLLALLAGGAR